MDHAVQILRQHQFRNTKLRHAVLTRLMDAGTGLSHQELSQSLDIPFDRVTLFRTLSTFEEAGILHKIMDLNGTSKYAFTATSGHKGERDHAHFLCLKCDKIFCLDEAFPITEINVPSGFNKLYLDVKIKGICRYCQNQGSKKVKKQ